MSDCRIGLANGIFQKARAAFSGLYKAAMAIGTESKSSVERLASARRSDGTL
jgi:hypothetical protein